MRLLPVEIEDQKENLIDMEALAYIEEKVDSMSLSQALIKQLAGPKYIAQTVADIMHNGASDGVRLRAAELASNMGGHAANREASTIQINIQGDNVQLNGLFCPTR